MLLLPTKVTGKIFVLQLLLSKKPLPSQSPLENVSLASIFSVPVNAAFALGPSIKYVRSKGEGVNQGKYVHLLFLKHHFIV